MNIPGFTAEASVDQSRGRYRFVADQDAHMGRGLLPQLNDTDLPGATCGTAPVFGNVICTECTQGPFPSCKTYVCDRNGNNCKETVRVNTQQVAAWRSDTASVFALPRQL